MASNRLSWSTGRPNRVRFGIVMVNKLYLFGGQNDNGVMLGDLWQFNPSVGAWSELTPSLDLAQPAPRHRPALSYFVNTQYSQGLLIVFGGHTQTAVFNDFWVHSHTDFRRT